VSATGSLSLQKLSQQIELHLLDCVRSGKHPVGGPMPSERQLMEVFDVGRPAVREALQALERKGLITIAHGERARVVDPTADVVIGQISDIGRHLLENSPQMLEHLKQARLFFEIGMVRIAAQQATSTDIQRLRAALADQERAAIEDLDRFLEKDMIFHRVIASIAGNPIYTALIQAIFEWLSRFHVEHVRLRGAEKLTLSEHRKILQRIAQGDEEGAVTAMIKHLTRANKLYARLASRNRGAARASGRTRP
jgi:DNA-binding FadR family transcriptional regulator